MSNNDTHSRRRVLKGAGAAGAAGMLGLAGCLTGEDGGTTVEVLHAWTGGDGKRAQQALFDAFDEEYPDMDFEDEAIGGGGNQSLDQTIATRLRNSNPPSSFAGWPGANLERYGDALGNIESEVWEEAGFEDSHIQEAVEACQHNDGYSAVPLGSHRMNDIFYNVSVLEEAGVDPESIDDADALIEAFDTIQSETDATPLGMSLKPWAILQTWAVVMLGTQGYQAYMDFINGEGDEEAVRETFETLEEMLSDYINSDAASVGFTSVNEEIMNGEAAFIHGGNWLAGAYISEELTYGEEWDAIRFPGTEDMYGLHIDSFIYPGENPTPEDTATFLQFIGGETAQVAFNQYKGSIPTRTDVPTDEFNPYLTETIEDFNEVSDKPPTLAHGLAVDQQTQSDLEGVLNDNFADPYDVDGATEGFMNNV
ncbi:ABC transporter substrate-binding protein [Halostagnicola kamekurae]|uniref:Carbohydrate ABC transporter substrate-binding protein, CUT1 family n=1 Tax=Halostagnicola kamekurae TaxID=619731 RepID=A0A1I6U3B0_9EURY|nr:ABC transporter substrate-binding protein [Halostagnicola kamekurae]SFS95901.1 carbohydrate ABC transporter substrate-binding protein, CUT1 family [Halostagnicola kamekurae]